MPREYACAVDIDALRALAQPEQAGDNVYARHLLDVLDELDVQIDATDTVAGAYSEARARAERNAELAFRLAIAAALASATALAAIGLCARVMA